MEIIEFDVSSSFDRPEILGNLLRCIPTTNDWIWSILDFDGIGKVPRNMSVSDFTFTVFNESAGLQLGFLEIKQFVSQLEDVWDFYIVAAESSNNIEDYKSSEYTHSECCQVIIELIDGGTWSIGAQNHNIQEKFMQIKTLEIAKVSDE